MENAVKPYLIGIAGRAGAGKNTVAALIRKHLKYRGLGSVERSFAAPIKRICGQVFDFTDEQTNGALKETPDPRYQRADGTYLTPREAMQRLGTEWGRWCYPRVWIDLGLRLAREAIDGGVSVLFTDVRFVNEAKAIQEAGGLVLYVTRPSASAVASTHPSETEMTGDEFQRYVDLYFENRGTLEDLEEAIQTAVGLLPSVRQRIEEHRAIEVKRAQDRRARL